MGASITLAGESLIAQKQGAKQILDVARFVLANVPGLNSSAPVDRAAGKPGAAQIVGTYPVTQAGFVNPNQVVYSLMLGSDVGDFDFNWIGLESAENVLLAVAYLPLQQKRRNIPPHQIGNNLTRNFLVVFDGAKELTAIRIDASTWQHDFTARLAGIDERERLSNRDVFGRACFFGSSLQLERVASVYQVKPGTAYVEGIHLQVGAVTAVPAPTVLPTVAWLDVALQRDQSNVSATWKVVYGADYADYTDSAGVRHYCVPIADVSSSSTVTERRSVEGISGPLVAHFAARDGDYQNLRARATTKEDVKLDQVPNAVAKASQVSSKSDSVLATTAFVRAVINNPEYLASSTRNLSQGTDQQDPNLAVSPVIVTKHANCPDGVRGLYWHITTTFYGTVTDSSDRAQLAVSYNDATPAVWARSCTQSTWLPWVRLTDTAYVKRALNEFGLGTAQGGAAMPVLTNLNRTVATGTYACGAFTGGAPSSGPGIVQVSSTGVGNNLDFRWVTLANGDVWVRTIDNNVIGTWGRQLSDKIINSLYPITSAAGGHSFPMVGGMVLKCGTYSKGSAFAEGEIVTLSFPDAFPTACLWGGAMPVNSSAGVNHETMYLRRSMSRTNAVIQAEGVSQSGLNGTEFAWMFVGY